MTQGLIADLVRLPETAVNVACRWPRGPVFVNGTRYHLPQRPVVEVGIDGGDPAYLRQGIEQGCIPHIASFIQHGFSVIADGKVPSFTCPNNMSIVTGTPGSRHDIHGIFYRDAVMGHEIDLTSPELWRG